MGSLGEALASRRRRCFVGRVAETELFRAALGASEPPFAVLHVHGPGGRGKTSLLDRFAAQAEEAGVHVARLDGRGLVPSPPAALAALRASVDVPDDDAMKRRSARHRHGAACVSAHVFAYFVSGPLVYVEPPHIGCPGTLDGPSVLP